MSGATSACRRGQSFSKNFVSNLAVSRLNFDEMSILDRRTRDAANCRNKPALVNLKRRLHGWTLHARWQTGKGLAFTPPHYFLSSKKRILRLL